MEDRGWEVYPILLSLVHTLAYILLLWRVMLMSYNEFSKILRFLWRFVSPLPIKFMGKPCPRPRFFFQSRESYISRCIPINSPFWTWNCFTAFTYAIGFPLGVWCRVGVGRWISPEEENWPSPPMIITIPSPHTHAKSVKSPSP